MLFFFFKQKTAYEMRISDWSSDVCSSDLGLVAAEQHSKLTDPIDQHEWMHSSLARSQASINSKLSTGLAFLATVGSTAPFIGLFGKIGRASCRDRVCQCV